MTSPRQWRGLISQFNGSDQARAHKGQSQVPREPRQALKEQSWGLVCCYGKPDFKEDWGQKTTRAETPERLIPSILNPQPKTILILNY